MNKIKNNWLLFKLLRQENRSTCNGPMQNRYLAFLPQVSTGEEDVTFWQEQSSLSAPWQFLLGGGNHDSSRNSRGLFLDLNSLTIPILRWKNLTPKSKCLNISLIIFWTKSIGKVLPSVPPVWSHVQHGPWCGTWQLDTWPVASMVQQQDGEQWGGLWPDEPFVYIERCVSQNDAAFVLWGWKKIMHWLCTSLSHLEMLTHLRYPCVKRGLLNIFWEKSLNSNGTSKKQQYYN